MTATRGEAEAEGQIAAVLALLDGALGDAVLGVYLYGSSTLGGRQRYSDIDLLAVIARPTTLDEKRRLAAGLLEHSSTDPRGPLRSIELTIVVQSAVRPWRYPPHFDFQYGGWLRPAFEAGNVTPWRTTAVPDLALLLTQARIASRALAGPPAVELLDSVPYRDYLTATLDEAGRWLENLDGDTGGVLLALARMWYTVETSGIAPKDVAAAWALPQLPAEHRPVLARARALYLGEADDHWDDLRDHIRPCAEALLARTREALARIDPDDPARAIHLRDL